MAGSGTPGHTAAKPADARRSTLRLVARLLLGLVKRIHAVTLIAIVLWLSWKAFWYLLDSLIISAPPPAQIVDLPLRLDESVLERATGTFAGIAATRNPRTPPGHYHRIEHWYQPDRFNDCTRGGCHVPLPHGRNKTDRAFLNMHATSIHCGVCHIKSEDRPLPLTWYSLRDGTPTQAPALLRVYGWLTSQAGQEALANPTSAVQEKLSRLLEQAAEEAGGDPALIRLTKEVEAIRYTSDRFQVVVAGVRAHVPLHFRGEYGAKLALRDKLTGRPILGHPETAAAVRDFLERGERLGQAERAALLERVHPPRRTESLVCSACHRKGEALTELQTVGYPPERIRSLQEDWIFRTIEHIVQGRPLLLPGFVLPEVPASAPATLPLRPP